MAAVPQGAVVAGFLTAWMLSCPPCEANIRSRATFSHGVILLIPGFQTKAPFKRFHSIWFGVCPAETLQTSAYRPQVLSPSAIYSFSFWVATVNRALWP